jgi:hypothetical protein
MIQIVSSPERERGDLGDIPSLALGAGKFGVGKD